MMEGDCVSKSFDESEEDEEPIRRKLWKFGKIIEVINGAWFFEKVEFWTGRSKKDTLDGN